MLRQFFFDAFRKILFESLQYSSDKQLAAIAEKSLKETKYHLKHSSEWVIRLGDGTEESHLKMQESLNTLWRYTDELFFKDEVDRYLTEKKVIPDLDLKGVWKENVDHILQLAKLEIPTNNWQFEGGRVGRHSEHMGFLLAELQYMQRTYPNMEW
jgi:ring-1,2-phenylacetyl-CoA epoxidase subunit PaaC